MIRESPTRALWIAIPRAGRQRSAVGGDGFQQRRRDQGHTDPSLDGCSYPSAWHLHGRRVLPDIKVGFDYTAMPVAGSEFLNAQLAGGGGDNQRSFVSRIIDSHHIQERFGIGFIMQAVPAPQSNLAFRAGDLTLFVRRKFGYSFPWMQDRSMRKRTAFLAAARARRRPQFGVDAQSPHQRILLGSRRKLLLGGNPGIDDNQPFSFAFWQIGKRLGNRLFA